MVGGVHVALDTFPYSGATTTVDCLSVGVPVVTLSGASYASRMSASLLTACGMEDTVCSCASDYVDTAVALALSGRDQPADREGRIRKFVESPLCDPGLFAQGWMTAVQEFVRGRSVLAAQ